MQDETWLDGGVRLAGPVPGDESTTDHDLGQLDHVTDANMEMMLLDEPVRRPWFAARRRQVRAQVTVNLIVLIRKKN